MRTITPMIVRRVATIDENKSILDAAILMTQEFIGSVVITNSSGISGLFTERELVMKVVGKRKDATSRGEARNPVTFSAPRWTAIMYCSALSPDAP